MKLNYSKPIIAAVLVAGIGLASEQSLKAYVVPEKAAHNKTKGGTSRPARQPEHRQPSVQAGTGRAHGGASPQVAASQPQRGGRVQSTGRRPVSGTSTARWGRRSETNRSGGGNRQQGMAAQWHRHGQGNAPGGQGRSNNQLAQQGQSNHNHGRASGSANGQRHGSGAQSQGQSAGSGNGLAAASTPVQGTASSAPKPAASPASTGPSVASLENTAANSLVSGLVSSGEKALLGGDSSSGILSDIGDVGSTILDGLESFL